MIPIGMEKKRLASGVVKLPIATRPPGFSTRRISINAPMRSGKYTSPRRAPSNAQNYTSVCFRRRGASNLRGQNRQSGLADQIAAIGMMEALKLDRARAIEGGTHT